MSKSTAALPISSQVQVESVYGKGVALAAIITVIGPGLNGNGIANANGAVGGGGYKPKGLPQGQEPEDDGGSEDKANARIEVSKSVAQEQLKALAQQRGIVTHNTHRKRKSLGTTRLTTLDDNVVPPWVPSPQPPPSTGSYDKANAGIQVFKSVAQERLKALAQRRGIVTHNTHRKPMSTGSRLTTLGDNVVPPCVLGPQPPSTGSYGQLCDRVSDRRPYPVEHPTPTPIPVEHPYNLPPLAAPSTQRTTRRQMLQTEMSESLRRNLPWEQQASKVNLVRYRDSASTNGGGNKVLGLKPLMTTPRMVQLRAKGEAGNFAAGLSAERTR